MRRSRPKAIAERHFEIAAVMGRSLSPRGKGQYLEQKGQNTAPCPLALHLGSGILGGQLSGVRGQGEFVGAEAVGCRTAYLLAVVRC